MFGDFDKYIAVFLTALVVTYLLTPLVRELACRFGVMDLPDERRPHKHPTARGGGLAVVLGVNAACLVALAFPAGALAGRVEGIGPNRTVSLVSRLPVVGEGAHHRTRGGCAPHFN
jgi:UDP-N-acetylmuramyl pentapeptide phosphotransferase/UDP-N-acetylglucosamine-1-phosphate transferase